MPQSEFLWGNTEDFKNRLSCGGCEYANASSDGRYDCYRRYLWCTSGGCVRCRQPDESIASLVVLALSMTLPPFISQNFGAGKIERVREAYQKTLQFVLIWQLLIYLLLLAVGHWIALAFASESQVRELISLFIYILPLSYGLQGVIILTNSSFNALHRPMNALVLSVIRLFVFYVPIAYVGSLIADLSGLFIGAAMGNLFTAVVAYLWFTHELKRHSQQ